MDEQELLRHYEAKLALGSKTAGFIIAWRGEPIGYIQHYLIADYPEHEEAVGAVDGAAGIDLFIGLPELLGQGLGPKVIRQFLEEIVFALDRTTCCIVDPSICNSRSIRAFAKCGFVQVRESRSPDGRETAVMMLRRENQQR